MRSYAGFETLLRRAMLGLTLLLPFVLGFLTTYFLLLVLIVVTGYLALQRRTTRPSLDLAGRLFLVAFLVLAADIAITTITAGRWHDLVYALDFGMLVLYGPIAALYDRGANPRNSGVVANLALLGTLLALGIALVEKLVEPSYRVGGINFDPIRFSDTAVVLGFLSLMGLLACQGSRRWIYLLGPLSGLVVTVLSGSRSAMLAFPLLVVLAIVMLIERKRVALAAAAAAVVAGGLALVFVAGRFSDERSMTVFTAAKTLLTGGSVAEDSILQRFAIYRAGLQAFWQSPVFGVGWHHKMEAIRPFLPDEYKSLADLPHLHNEVVNFAVGTGVVGVLVYLVLLVVPIAVCLRSPRDSQFHARLYGSTLLVGSYFALGLADVMVGFELHTALYVVLTALLLSYCRDRPAANGGAKSVT